MANLEDRVASLESQTDRHALAVEALRVDIAHLRVDLRTEVATLRGGMALRSETADLQRGLAAARAEMATRTDVGDLRSEVGDLRREMGDLRNDTNRRLDLLDAKVDRHFVWLMGMMVTGFISVIGALVGVVYR